MIMIMGDDDDINNVRKNIIYSHSDTTEEYYTWLYLLHYKWTHKTHNDIEYKEGSRISLGWYILLVVNKQTIMFTW